MSINNFSDDLVMVTAGHPLPYPNNKVSFAVITGDDRQVEHIQAYIYFDGQFTTEEIYLNISDDVYNPSLSYTSDAVVVVEAIPELATSKKFLAKIRFDFAGQFLLSSTNYNLSLVTKNYTEGASKTIAAVINDPYYVQLFSKG